MCALREKDKPERAQRSLYPQALKKLVTIDPHDSPGAALARRVQRLKRFQDGAECFPSARGRDRMGRRN